MSETIKEDVVELKTTVKLFIEHSTKNTERICTDIKCLNDRVTSLEHWETKTKTGWTALGLAFGAGGVATQGINKLIEFLGG